MHHVAAVVFTLPGALLQGPDRYGPELITTSSPRIRGDFIVGVEGRTVYSM